MPNEASQKADRESLDATWWLLDNVDGFDDLYEKAGAVLDQMVTDLKIEIFRDMDREKRLYLARFEFPKYGEEMTFPEAVFTNDKGSTAGFIDFLGGFPVDCVEMMLVIGQFSTKADKVKVKEGKWIVPPVPEQFFHWPDMDKVIYNLTAIPRKNFGKFLADNLEGEPKPHNVHWWFRINLRYKQKMIDLGSAGLAIHYPVPGEFLALGVRMMPDRPWGHQKSHPFLYAGNWMDTVYYTSGRIVEIKAPTDGAFPWNEYSVHWRVCPQSDSDGLITKVRPTDFAEYHAPEGDKPGDFVAILKDVSTTKTTELWKDDDMFAFGFVYQIAPIGFYALERPEV